jgi:hypothetical protein
LLKALRTLSNAELPDTRPVNSRIRHRKMNKRMPNFRKQTRSFLRDLSRAAEWMMSRHVGEGHWWRSVVLTEKNPDTSKRPIFDDATAAKIFDEMISRGLLVKHAGNVDDSNVPIFFMKYDLEGWDKTISDGRPVYAWFLKAKRNWAFILLAFLLGCIVTTFESRVVGMLDNVLDAIVFTEASNNNQETPASLDKEEPESAVNAGRAERIRLDCVSAANHNLNRLLDKPCNGTALAIRKYLF